MLGIDHFYALKMIDEVHAQGGKARCPRSRQPPHPARPTRRAHLGPALIRTCPDPSDHGWSRLRSS